jgi:SDR family mycofactocin-dependent oxidoreductase
MAGRVEGKVAFVTGAARGQGRAHAVHLAEEGADIIAVDLCDELPDMVYESSTPEDLAETVRQVEALDRRIISAQVDVRDLAKLKSTVDSAVTELGGLDIVVANAGICRAAEWDQVTEKLFDDHIEINVRGVWNTVMAGAPHLVTRGGGSIIMTSSAAGIRVQPFLVHYTTSKFAVRGMAKAFAVELGEHKIRVNSLHPCAVDTPMASQPVMDSIAGSLEAHPGLGGMFANILPYDKADVRDMSNAVVFLASDESRFITAHEMVPDAGVTEY